MAHGSFLVVLDHGPRWASFGARALIMSLFLVATNVRRNSLRSPTHQTFPLGRRLQRTGQWRETTLEHPACIYSDCSCLVPSSTPEVYHLKRRAGRSLGIGISGCCFCLGEK